MRNAADVHAKSIKKLESALTDGKTSHATLLADAKAEHESALSTLRTEHDKELKTVRESQADATATAASAASRQAGDEAAAAAAAGKKRVAELEEELATVKKQLTVSKGLLEKSLRDKKQSDATTTATTTTTKSDTDSDADSGAAKKEAEAEAAQKIEAAVRAARDEAAVQTTELQSKLDKLNADLTRTRERLQAAEEKHKTAELDRTKAREEVGKLESAAAAAAAAAAIAEETATAEKEMKERVTEDDSAGAALAKVTAERDELRKQLEQAQEDLMLLMEAETEE